MNRDDIVAVPSKILRKRSQRVPVIDEEIKQLAQDMIKATLDWEDHRQHETGVAMAAIQVGKPQRIIIVRNDPQQKDDRSFSVYLNPEIVKTEGKPEIDPEGCLSVPEIYGQVPRYPKVKVKALDLNGQRVRLTAEGFLARVLQHEIDHLHGRLFIDKVEDDNFLKLDQDGELSPLTGKDLLKARKSLGL